MNMHAMTGIDWEKRARRLQQQVDDMEHELSSLKSALNSTPMPYLPHLTTMHTELLRLLRMRSPNYVTLEQMYDLLYSRRHSDKDAPDPKTVRVHVCHVRTRLKKHYPEIELQLVHGRGYFMYAASAKAWDEAAHLKNVKG